MSTTVARDRPLLLLIAGWMAFAVASITLRPLWPVDETRYASVAWEMWERGSLLVPFVNGEPYAHKPPLLFWLIHAGWAVFGVNDWWPRLVAPVCAIAAVPLITRIDRLLASADEPPTTTPVWVLFGCLLFVAFITLTMFDLLLMVCAMIAIIGLVRAARGERRAGFAWLGVGIGLGVLAKGPVILLHVLPVALVAPWWAPATRTNAGRWYLGVFGGVLIGAMIGLAWAIPAALAGGEAYARAIFWGQTAGRVSESFAHRAPVWYYVPLLPVMFFPWLVWPAFWRGAGMLRRDRGMRARFAIAWLALPLVALSLVSGKQAKYVVPVLPAVALLVGQAVARARTARRYDLALPALGFVGGALALVAVRALPARFSLPAWAAELPLWPAAALLAVGVVLFAASRRSLELQMRALAASMLVATFVLAAGLLPALVPFNDVRPVAARIAALQAQGIPVAFLGKYHAQYNFAGRLEQPVAILDDPELAAWVAQHPNGRVVDIERERRGDSTRVPEFEAPFRGQWVQLWRGPVLASMPAIVQ